PDGLDANDHSKVLCVQHRRLGSGRKMRASGQGLCWEVMDGRGGNSGSGREGQKSRELVVQVVAGNKG
nr:hypothetical protein [Tanacetum cinerariifolium]